MKLIKIRFVQAAAIAAFSVGSMFLMPTNTLASTVSDRATGLTSPGTVVDFGNGDFVNNTSITTQYNSLGVSFAPNFNYADLDSPGPTIVEGYLLSGNTSSAPGSIFFSSNVTDAVFSWLTTTSRTTTFEAYLANSLVETFSATTDSAIALGTGSFFGFENILFDEIRLSISDGTQGFTLDNLQFNAASVVPIPAALPLFGTALLGLGFAGYRRRKAKAA